MLKIATIKKWIQGLNVAEHCYTGRSTNEVRSILIYQQENETSSRLCIGGLSSTLTKVKQITLQIYWSNNYEETEEKSLEVYELLQGVDKVSLSNQIMVDVKYIQLLDNEPMDIGEDENSIYQREIKMNIYYNERKE